MSKLNRSLRQLKQTQQCSEEGLERKEVQVSVLFENSKVKSKNITLCLKQGNIISQHLFPSMLRFYELNERDSLSYWDSNRGSYLFWCLIGDSSPHDLNQNLIVDNQLKLRVRKAKPSHLESLLEQQRHSLSVKQSRLSKNKEVAKDKQLGEIIKKVSLWRMLYLGFQTLDGEQVEKPLDTAASHVGTAKKTLDDYLLHIRSARQKGFDFNTSQKQSIGHLRQFVKANKQVKRN